jgi:hypothetical protein
VADKDTHYASRAVAATDSGVADGLLRVERHQLQQMLRIGAVQQDLAAAPQRRARHVPRAVQLLR